MSGYWESISYFFSLPFHIQWRTALVQLPRFAPLAILHLTSPKGPHPFVIALPSRKDASIPIYVFIPPKPVGSDDERARTGEWKVPVVLDFHGGGFIMGAPLEQANYAAMMSRELGAVVISVSYRIGPFSTFPAAIHDAEDVLAAILDTDGVSKAGRVLRRGIQRDYTQTRTAMLKKKKKINLVPHFKDVSKITLDPTRLAISGFSAGGNIALNMALSVPPCPNLLNSPTTTTAESSTNTVSAADTLSPLLPPVRAPTKLDDPARPWPSLLPPPQVQPRMLPLLLFYPSLDARLLPHERPMKPMPNALKGDDHTIQKPRKPGLFSIMGPTYLPRRLRAHPRASPGLVHPENIQRNAAMFLVLPEKDSLAVQSDVWVDNLNTYGWTGPVRFGDGRRGDWNGREGGRLYIQGYENGGLEVWHAPNCRHGWTQFPGLFLGKHETKERDLVFERTLDFVRAEWKKELLIGQLENGNLGQLGDGNPEQNPEQLGNENPERRPLEPLEMMVPLELPSRFNGK